LDADAIQDRRHVPAANRVVDKEPQGRGAGRASASRELGQQLQQDQPDEQDTPNDEGKQLETARQTL
jgi:hypothetical protein